MTEIAVAEKKDELVKIIKAADMDIEVQRLVKQAIAIKTVMATLMIPKVHYGVIEGTDKPTLFQPGADMLCSLFRLKPKYIVKETLVEKYIRYRTRCRLIHIPTREEWGEGMGAANSREKKYLNQSAGKLCPACAKPAIMVSKYNGGGWYCNPKRQGCGANFPENDKRLKEQAVVEVNADAVYDLDNTLLKMANKRAKVAAVLTATAASDVFDQDLEDLEDKAQGLAEDVATKAAESNGGAAKPNGNGGNGQSASNGNGAKRASPVQIRGLMEILQDRGVPFEKRLAWMNAQLASKGKKPIEQFNDLAAEDADKLTMAAKNGEGLE